MRVIEVLGSGCPNCQAVERNVRAALGTTGVEAEIRHVTDWVEISARGVMSTPGLVVDGTVVSAGRVPSSEQIAAWLLS